MANRYDDRDHGGRSSDPRVETSERRTNGRRIDCAERGRAQPGEYQGRGAPEPPEGERLRRAG